MAFKFPEKIDPNYNPNNSRTFKDGDPGSDNLANNHFQFLEFFHLPSSYFVAFKAYLTAFSDDYSSKWKDEEVYGRMDPISTFERTGRKITCGFKVVASSVQEAEQNMRRISLLTQMLYPSYETGNEETDPKKGQTVSTIKGSPLFKVKFLNWIQNSSLKQSVSAEDSGLMGHLNGISFKPNLDDGTFQTGLDLYPKYVDLTFTLTVIHEHNLGWDVSDAVRGKFDAGPSLGFDTFPYGKSTHQQKKPKKNKMSSKQETRFKEMASASKKLISGGG
jgi:hypothetical protein